jgi:hypothetical protein
MPALNPIARIFGSKTNPLRRFRKASGVVPPHVAARLGDFITAAADASVNDTMSTTLTDPQWYRQTVGVNPVDTKIDGATEQNYDLAPADAGFRPVVIGRDANGVLTKATALQVVLDAPILLASLDATTGASTLNGGTIALDTTRNVQGAGAIALTSDGTQSGSFSKADVAGPFDPSTLGTLAVYWNAGSDPELHQFSGESLRLGQNGSYPFNGRISDGASEGGVNDYKLNGYWEAQHVSENAAVSAFSPTTKIGYRAIGQQTGSPFNGTVLYDSLVARAGGFPTFVPGFDDLRPGQYSIAATMLEERGWRGTFYVPTALVGQASRITEAEVLDLAARGHDLQIDGRSDDTLITDFASEAAFRADLQAQKAWFAARGLPEPKHLCYPNGVFRGRNTAGTANVGGTRINVPSVTKTSGSAVVTMSSTTGITAGMKAVGKGLPTTAPFARVQSVDSGTQVTLTLNASLSGVHGMSFTNDQALFHTGRIQAIMAEEGIVSGRTTFQNTVFKGSRLTRFGEAGLAFTYPGFGVTGLTASQMQAGWTQAKLRGGTVEYYFHNVVSGGNVDGSSANPSIDVYAENLAIFLDAMKADEDAGIGMVLTKAQQHRRDGNASVPV